MRVAKPKLDRASWSALFDLIQELQDGDRISQFESSMLDDLCIADDSGLLEAFMEHRRTKKDFFALVAPLLRKARPRMRDNASWSQGGGPPISHPSLEPGRRQAWGDAVDGAKPPADHTLTKAFSGVQRPEPLPEPPATRPDEMIQPLGAPPAAMQPRPVSSALRNPAALQGLTQVPVEPTATAAPVPALAPSPPQAGKPVDQHQRAQLSPAASRATTRQNEGDLVSPISSAAASAKLPVVPDRLATPPSMRQQVYSKKGFAEACWKCQGPMKPEWKRCPGCKAPPGGLEEEGLQGAALLRAKSTTESVVSQSPAKTTEQSVKEFVMCTSCSAPCKAKWKECPSCKAPQKKVVK